MPASRVEGCESPAADGPEPIDVTEVRSNRARTVSEDPLLGARIGRRYRVLERIGRGGMGTVYRAEHVLLRAQVAIKVLHTHLADDAELMQRFVREARAAAASCSAHVVRVWDLDQLDDDRWYFVMEYLDGVDLAAWVATRGPLPIESAVAVGLQICDALRVMHPLGIVHRDLKPENVFAARSASGPPCVKVLDFGVCKVARDRPITGAGMTLGTPQFMSPEQLECGAEVDLRTDIYAVGALLFYALTGRAPFRGRSLGELLYRVCTEPAPPLRSLRPEAPEGLERVLARALEKQPSARFADGAELQRALAAFSGCA